MKTIIQVIVIIVAILWVSEIKITLKPFHVSFQNWRIAVGIIIICVGLGFYYAGAYYKGWNKAIDKVTEVIDNMKNNK